jgi:CRP-like cAMP-binding protein
MMAMLIEPPGTGPARCDSCNIRATVLFADLQEQDFKLIHRPIEQLTLQTGHPLYHENDLATHLYTIRSGVVKLVRISHDGRPRIVRILRTGDVIGLEAIAARRYHSEAIALTDVQLCQIPIAVVNNLRTASGSIHQQLMQKWHSALKEADNWLADINFGPAARRVRQFILKMRHPHEPQYTTLFSREDMGAMMDLKFETVSREVSALTKAGVIVPIDKRRRAYRIADVAALSDPLN